MAKLWSMFVALCTLAVLSACSDPPQLSPLPNDAVILAFGDSLTRGTGTSEANSYPSELARLSGLKVVNAGVPGEVTADGLRRLPKVLEKFQPDLLILCHGGNDMLRKKDLGAAASNIRQMLKLAEQSGIPAILVGVPKPGLLLGTADFYAEIAESLQIPAELEVLSKVLADGAMKADAVHPNAAGYAKIATAIHALLRRSGAL